MILDTVEKNIWWQKSGLMYITPSVSIDLSKGKVENLDKNIIQEHIEIELNFDFMLLRSFIVFHIRY
tara:strand:- start:2453 stop:2653 length:201 start_codon:yes stop_codon:yes gene_type:complete